MKHSTPNTKRRTGNEFFHFKGVVLGLKGTRCNLESGLYYYGARYYSAWTCRFISVDALAGDYAYFSPFHYAGNNPIRYIDLDGLEPAVSPSGNIIDNQGNEGPNPESGEPIVVYTYTQSEEDNNLGEPKRHYQRAWYYNVTKEVAAQYDKQNALNDGQGAAVTNKTAKIAKGWHGSDGPPARRVTFNTTLNRQITKFIGRSIPGSSPTSSTRVITVPGNPGDSVAATFTYNSFTPLPNGFRITNLTTGQSVSTNGTQNGSGTLSLPTMSPGDVIRIDQMANDGQEGVDAWIYTLEITADGVIISTNQTGGSTGQTNGPRFNPQTNPPQIRYNTPNVNNQQSEVPTRGR